MFKISIVVLYRTFVWPPFDDIKLIAGTRPRRWDLGNAILGTEEGDWEIEWIKI
jgi:hypothetical protein